MTPKQQYEARKAERKVRWEQQAKNGGWEEAGQQRDAEMTDMIDRFVTTVERIADVLELRLQHNNKGVNKDAS